LRYKHDNVKDFTFQEKREKIDVELFFWHFWHKKQLFRGEIKCVFFSFFKFVDAYTKLNFLGRNGSAFCF